LLALNHESWFENSAPVVVLLVLRLGLPPKAIVARPVDPSSKRELMRTVPLGISRYGVA
jgi:hypothetical protein